MILNGAGVVIGGAIPDCAALAERLDAPVCFGYQHNDSFPGTHPLACGPLGYNGSKAAMELIAKADVVLALGTRLNPFSTLPGYGIDYWPKKAKIIQVDINPDRIGLTKPVTVGICGDAKKVARQILGRLAPTAGNAGREERKALIHKTKSAWLQALSGMDHEDDDPGTTWNERARKRDPERMAPRQAWRAIQAALPKDAIISSDIGNNCAIGNAYPTFEQGRKYLAPGLFGPCGYGFPSIIGAKIGCPDTPVVGFAGDGAFGISMTEMTLDRPEGMAGASPWSSSATTSGAPRSGTRRSGTTTISSAPSSIRTCPTPRSPRPAASRACTVKTQDELTAALQGSCEAQMKRQDHAHRGDPQPGTRRAVPPRRDEEAGGRRRHLEERHAAAEGGVRGGAHWVARQLPSPPPLRGRGRGRCSSAGRGRGAAACSKARFWRVVVR